MKTLLRNTARKGATAVEFAIASVILFTFIFAAVEFARINTISDTVQNAAYEAARHVIVPGGSEAEARQSVQRMLDITGIKNATVTISPNPILETSPLVTVNVSVPLDDNTWGVSLFGRGRNIASSSTLHTERAPVIQAQALPTNPVPPVVIPPTKPPANPPSTPIPPKPTKPSKPKPPVTKPPVVKPPQPVPRR